MGGGAHERHHRALEPGPRHPKKLSVSVATWQRRDFEEGRFLRQDCRVCADSPEARKAWGCESRAEAAQVWIPCEDCGGTDPRCGTCGGTGFEGIHRCPWSWITSESRELLQLHEHFPELLPYPGGLYDQPAGYVDAMRVIAKRKNELERKLHELAEAKQPKR